MAHTFVCRMASRLPFHISPLRSFRHSLANQREPVSVVNYMPLTAKAHRKPICSHCWPIVQNNKKGMLPPGFEPGPFRSAFDTLYGRGIAECATATPEGLLIDNIHTGSFSIWRYRHRGWEIVEQAKRDAPPGSRTRFFMGIRSVNPQPWAGELDESERVTGTPKGPSSVGKDSDGFSICGMRHQLRSHGLIRTTTGSNRGTLFLLYISMTQFNSYHPCIRRQTLIALPYRNSHADDIVDISSLFPAPPFRYLRISLPRIQLAGGGGVSNKLL